MRGAARLRALLEAGETVVAPGAMNAFFGRLIEHAGFEVVYMSGAGVANGMLGVPDLGLTTLTETAAAAAYMATAVEIPVIADADAGYGGVLNIERTVREFERAGVAAIQLEDQVSPKRCGHFRGKEVVARDEMRARVSAACNARRDPDTVIIARTDARSVLGLDEALSRCQLYAAEGADVLFCEAPVSEAELLRIGTELAGVPLVANMVEGGRTPLRGAKELRALGFQIVLFPGLLTRVVTRAALQALDVLRTAGDSRSLLDRISTFTEVNELLGLSALELHVEALETRKAIAHDAH